MAAILGRAHALLHKTLKPTTPLLAAISTFRFLSQELELQETPSSPATAAPLPLNPSNGSPFYQENWHVPNAGPSPTLGGQSLVPLGGSTATQMMAFSQTLDVASLMNVFADWMTSQQWSNLKQLFEF